MASKEEINLYHREMLVEFLRGLKEGDDPCAMMLIALRTTPTGVAVEVHCGGSTHDIYRASATLLESVLKPGALGTSRILNDNERLKVKALANGIMSLAGYSDDDVVDLGFECEPMKRK